MRYFTSQLSVLRLIASDCPQEGGAAVHQARGMLSQVEDVNFLDFDCSSNLRSRLMEQEEEASTREWNITLYPNPTNDQLTVESNQLLEDVTTIEIYNSLGQEVRCLKITKTSHLMELNTTKLQDGIYFLQITTKESKTIQSFSISKK